MDILLLTSFTSLFCFAFCVSLIYTIIVHTTCETLDSSIHSVVNTPGERLVSSACFFGFFSSLFGLRHDWDFRFMWFWF